MRQPCEPDSALADSRMIQRTCPGRFNEPQGWGGDGIEVMDSDGGREEVAGHDAVAVGCARRCAGSAWPAGSPVRAEVGSGDRPGCDAGGSERSESDLGRRLRPEALRLFGIESGRSPCHASYHYFFQALDADALAATLGRYARGEATGGHIALDGKTLRGSRRLDAAPLHVLSAFATELGAVIGDLVVPPEANEITAALTLLKGLPLEGAIVTGDAIFAQREICRHVRDDKGHYLFVVKTNQPELHRDIAIAFGDASPL